MNGRLRVIDLGRMGYREAYEVQRAHLEEVLASREAGEPEAGRLLLVEHDPVITVSGRRGAEGHVLASADALRAAGVAVEATDRGGDVTYHGPGQLVAYPILDLNALRLRLHEHVRLLESAAIGVCARFGVRAHREPGATGVWVAGPEGEGGGERGSAKVCAIGVRVRRWVSMHGLAINVTTDLSHFDLIVPCGLAGRAVTSLERELGAACPSMEQVKAVLAEEMRRGVQGERASGTEHESEWLRGGLSEP
ncbi:MAG: lipoyl(octanoyl) transferase LipB [Leptolyngbya sp. PLA2]|nr:lipoyl(octanoyl) transferase LipB [Leptolyngbya sp.]MCE7971625.1 lipoyl(octanoyl) transferase LipB [Leptolyngbya sp. PL-A2]MCQ3940055.1 lipoate--protein ligase [cyanobacterium CYA1]MDL1903203.1 lipoyl(octanoyl) transferase LipB [Synechococcales cyanobacterium CNB]GIK17900.1 MAG: octanoyltransferase [Planctomycetota bacterium]